LRTGSESGWRYEADGYLLGASARLGDGGLVAVTGGIGAGGVRGASATHVPVELSLELPLGAVRLLSRATLAWRLSGARWPAAAATATAAAARSAGDPGGAAADHGRARHDRGRERRPGRVDADRADAAGGHVGVRRLRAVPDRRVVRGQRRRRDQRQHVDPD